ncbi:MAG: hypothetical protein PHO30_01100 [Candidatus Omnitrophica bacterium]|nr:hypothetical protein [Candidatus Omnitrophota bacterium]
MDDIIYERVRRIAGAIAEAEAIEVVEVNVYPRGAGGEIRIVVDKAGGIGLDACAGFNRAIINQLEAEGVAVGDYALEVCSPGLDRPLKTVSDFKRVSGERIYCLARTSDGKTRDITGVVVAVGERDIAIMLNDGRQVTINTDDILKAKLEIRW